MNTYTTVIVKNRMRQSNCWSLYCNLMSCFFIICIPVYADEVDAFKGYQNKSLGNVREQYRKIKEQYPDNVDLKEFDQRIALIDELAVKIIKQLDSVKSQAMQGMIGMDIAPITKPANKDVSLSALDLITEYQVPFSKSLPVPDIDPSKSQILRDYYDKAIGAAMDFITPRGCSAAIMNKAESKNTIGMTMVIHFLHISDKAWNVACIERLPDQMKTPGMLETLEEVSFKLYRPSTAYKFYQYRTKSEKYDPDYFVQNSSKLLVREEYLSSIRCLIAGIEIGKKYDCTDKTIQLSVELADVYYKMAHLNLAVEALEDVLELDLKQTEIGKVVTLQLKYLYEDGKYTEVMAKSFAYHKREQCEPYQPEIMYLNWLANSKSNLQDSADAIKDEFLARYPRSPFCASLLFDSAVAAIADADYSESLLILNKIEYHYPESKLLPQVRRLKKTLNDLEQQQHYVPSPTLK